MYPTRPFPWVDTGSSPVGQDPGLGYWGVTRTHKKRLTEEVGQGAVPLPGPPREPVTLLEDTVVGPLEDGGPPPGPRRPAVRVVADAGVHERGTPYTCPDPV